MVLPTSGLRQVALTRLALQAPPEWVGLMSVKILKARLKLPERYPDLETFTFVWDERDEASEDAVLDLIRLGATVEDFRIAAVTRSRPAFGGLSGLLH